LKDISKDLQPVFKAFRNNESLRTCPSCNAVHPA